MKKNYETPEGGFEISVDLNSTGRFHRVTCAADGHHEEKLCSTALLEQTILEMGHEARLRHCDPVAILLSLGFEK
jgi:hypothetical protein